MKKNQYKYSFGNKLDGAKVLEFLSEFDMNTLCSLEQSVSKNDSEDLEKAILEKYSIEELNNYVEDSLYFGCDDLEWYAQAQEWIRKAQSID